MIRVNRRYWQDYITNRLRPQFKHFGEVVLSRIMPVFDQINQEATDLQDRRYRELMDNAEFRQEDAWDAAEAMADLALQEAIDYYEVLASMQAASFNLFSAAIYHLHEQHITEVCLRICEHHARTEVSPTDAINWLRDELSIDVKRFASWSVIRELGLVAHAVKHGEGRSAKALREIRPDLFVYPAFRKHGIGPRPSRIRTPLFGQDFYVTREDFVRYHEASVSFWDELAAHMGSPLS